jgi:hypothetical protein
MANSGGIKSAGTLFGPEGDDGWSNAVLLSDRWCDMPWDLYAQGYLRAGEAALERALSRRETDTLVYPIVFLYRHYVELKLKETLLAAGDLLDHDESLVTDHKLLALWRRCRPKLALIWSDSPRDELDDVEEIISELDAVDPGSFTFRYPVNKKGDCSLPPALTHLGLRRFHVAIRKVVDLLEGVSCGIAAYLQDKREMQSANRDW